MKKYCGNCGTKMAQDERFCAICGTKFESNVCSFMFFSMKKGSDCGKMVAQNWQKNDNDLAEHLMLGMRSLSAYPRETITASLAIPKNPLLSGDF